MTVVNEAVITAVNGMTTVDEVEMMAVDEVGMTAVNREAAR